MANRRNADLPPRLLRTQEAARFLGISIRTLRNKLRQYNDDGIAVPMPNEGVQRPSA